MERISLTDKPDTWIIPGAPSDSFSTGWFRDCLETHKTMGQTQQDFWQKWIPKKHNIFIWRFIRNRIPTRQCLSEMSLDIPCTLCPICDLKEEDTIHLFVDCKFARSLWTSLSQWWIVPIPDFKRSEDILTWTWFALKKYPERDWFQVVVIALLVTIWRVRNGVIFEKKKVDENRETRNFKELAFFWLNSRNGKFKQELGNWILNPNCKM